MVQFAKFTDEEFAEVGMLNLSTQAMHRLLRTLWACEDGIKWADTQPNACTAWETCERPDWLIWVACSLSLANHDEDLFVTVVGLLVDSIRHAAELHLPPEEPRALELLALVLPAAKGEGNLDELDQAGIEAGAMANEYTGSLSFVLEAIDFAADTVWYARSVDYDYEEAAMRASDVMVFLADTDLGAAALMALVRERITTERIMAAAEAALVV